MINRKYSVLFFLAVLCFVPVLSATPIPANVTSSFTGGAFGSWDFSFDSGPANLYLESITINLAPTNLKFDTAAGGFGALSSEDVGSYQGSDVTTGLSGVSATGAALDGGQLLTFTFSDFTAGKTFHFGADVDSVPLVLNCDALPSFLRKGCRTVNEGAKDASSIVIPSQFAGAEVTYTFGGRDYQTTQFTAAFSANGRLFGSGSAASANVPTPEPATFAMVGGCLLLVGGLLRRRSLK